MYGVGETLGGALPDDGEDLLEVGFVQLLLEEQHVLVEVLYRDGKKRRVQGCVSEDAITRNHATLGPGFWASLYEAVHVAAAVRYEGGALEQELLYHWRHLKVARRLS